MKQFKEITGKKIFLSGRVSYLSQEQVNQHFRFAKNCFDANFNEIIIPTELCKDMEDEAEIMFKCLREILTCDIVAMLPNWCYSDGAKIEFSWAKKFDKEIIYL